eukprot:gene17947-6215_t
MVPIRKDWINYLGGNIRLQGPVDIPDKFLKRIGRVQEMWQQQPDVPLRVIVSQSNAVITGCLRTQQAASLLRPSRTSEITRKTKVEVRRRLGIHNLPNDYLWAPVPYGLGLFDPDKEGARDALLAIASLNQCPSDSWSPIWASVRDGLRAMGQCCRTTVPQDGDWCRTSTHENTLAADTIVACTRLSATVTWDCGDCAQRGPLLVQRGVRHGQGLAPFPDVPGECTVFRPDAQRAWLEIWHIRGHCIPVVPLPADWMRWKDREKIPFGSNCLVTDKPQVPTAPLRPTGALALRRLFPLMERGTAAPSNPRAIALPVTVDRHDRAGHLPPGYPRGYPTVATALVYLHPRRVEWLEQRHAAGLGSRRTVNDWLHDLGSAPLMASRATPRMADSFLSLSPEVEYLLVSVLNLRCQVAANVFTALRSADSHTFRLATDGTFFVSRTSPTGMYPVNGTVVLMPTREEVYAMVNSAQLVWEEEPVAFAVVAPRSVLRNQLRLAAQGWNCDWDPVEAFIGEGAAQGTIALHLQGKGMTPVFSERETSLDLLTAANNPGDR